MTDERLWSRLKPYLEEYELIHLPLPLTDDFDKAIEEIDKKIEDENIYLLGFSLGAYVASYYTIKYPNKVKKLFLVAGTPSAMNEDEIVKRRMTLNQMNKFDFKGLSYKKAQSLLEKSNQNDEGLIHLVQDMFLNLGAEVYNIQMESTLVRKNIYNELIKSNIPTKFYYSTEDRLLTHKSLENFKEEHKNISLSSRTGTSHMIPLEFPSSLSCKIKEWFI